MQNYYSDPGSFSFIERAILMEEIKIGLPDELNLKYFNPELIVESKEISSGEMIEDKYYNFDFQKEYLSLIFSLKNVKAKFSVPIIMTDKISDEVMEISKSSPKSVGFKGSPLKASSYSSTTYIELTIPKHLLLNFFDKENIIILNNKKYVRIPKNSEFLIACIGGIFNVNRIKIVGINLR